MPVPSQDLDFQRHMSWCFLCSVRWLFILVIIGRIIDHHCLNFLEITRFFSVVHVALSLGLCVVFCRSLFTLLSYFCWPLFCLSFNLLILITPLVFSNSSNFSQVSKTRSTPGYVSITCCAVTQEV